MVDQRSDLSGSVVSSIPLNGEVQVGTVAIAAVPEPATWAMMFLGFAGVGFMAYRRSRKDGGLALPAT